jgi:tetratricopeptide (TPR) repeat protein
MANEVSDTHSVNAFSVSAVDKSNQRYLQVVKEFNDQAVACRRENDYECAIKDFTNAIKIEPDFALAHNNRGECHFKKGNLSAAEFDYRQALKIKLDFAVAFYNRGRLRLKEGDRDRAIADLKKALKIDPDFSRAYRLLSRLIKPDSKDVAAEQKKMLLTREED